MNKIVFITSHHWNTKRLGGFHKFAEHAADSRIETVFFSFPRPYYGYFMHREQLNRPLLRLLGKGKEYKTQAGNKILNVTFSTFRVPDRLSKFFPDLLVNWLLTHSFKTFKGFCKKYLAGSDCFVFESCEGIALLDKIKKLYPNAKIIYRPSDPLTFAAVPKRVKKMESHILKTADMSFIVNEEGLAAYRKNIPDFDITVKHQILSNGVDIDSYLKKYPVPEPLKQNNTVLYVGAWDIEWNLIFKAAEETPDFNYIIVCPNYPAENVLSRAKEYSNIVYIPGIKPSEVPAWVTNCNVFMVPYINGFYKDRPLGITAKYYQAMAACKPIVSYSDTQKAKEVGIAVTYTYEDFINEVKKAISTKVCHYSFNLEDRRWENITQTFINEIEKI